ncbi:hypothetical protein MRX96_029305 [Rhipicephalus microplus]
MCLNREARRSSSSPYLVSPQDAATTRAFRVPNKQSTNGAKLDRCPPNPATKQHTSDTNRNFGDSRRRQRPFSFFSPRLESLNYAAFSPAPTRPHVGPRKRPTEQLRK